MTEEIPVTKELKLSWTSKTMDWLINKRNKMIKNWKQWNINRKMKVVE